MSISLLLINTAVAANAPVSTAAEQAVMTDYEQQAILIVKIGLGGYVEWPNMVAVDGIKTINICLVGPSPGFMKSMEKYQALAAKKLKINIHESAEGENMLNCNIAYIAKSKGNYRDIIASTKQMPLLTVSTIGKFAENGGIMEMSISEVDAGGAPTNSKAKLSLIINNKSAVAAGLKIAPDFLENAAEVIR